MPNPWDPSKIKGNLKKLAELKPGNKVQFLDSGYIRINVRAFLRRSRDSISNPRAKRMFEDLFKHAVDYSKQAGVHSKSRYSAKTKPDVFISMGEIDNAIRGVEQLRGTYKKDSKRLNKVNEIIQSIKKINREGVNSVYDEEVAQRKEEVRNEIYSKFRKNLIVKVDHHRYLGIGESGICMVFTQDWIRRGYLESRPTYAMSGSFWRGFFPKPVEQRLQDKVDKRLRPISSGYYEYNRGDVPENQSSNWVALPYGKNLYGRKNMVKGINRLERSLVKKQDVPEGYENRQKGIIEPGRGQQVFLDIVNFARNLVPNAPRRLCMLNLGIWGTMKKRRRMEIHSVGFKLAKDTTNVHFFDSNLGEFLFEGDMALGQFGELWWKLYVVWGVAVDQWTLYEWRPAGK